MRVPNPKIAVHPHACGEHIINTVVCGTHRRFIPTPVGNIVTVTIGAVSDTVHPHACGEHKLSQIIVQNYLYGSSPRLWGTSAFGNVIVTNPGSSPPACGEHGSSGSSIHACGEHKSYPELYRGSSPPACGEHPFPVHPHACGEHNHLQQV